MSNDKLSPDEQAMWLTFISELEVMQATPDDRAAKAKFLRRFRSELVLMSFWMNQLAVTGGQMEIAASPPGKCDLCGCGLEDKGLFIDGQVTDGRWSFMCMVCFDKSGVGIGWGVGQLYRLMPPDADGERAWASIAGGNPLLDTGQ